MEVTQISTPLVWKEANTERILIGKVLSSKTYTRATMESILQKAWNLQSGFSAIEIYGNAFLFKFSSLEDYYRILRGRPWSMNGCALNLLERLKYNSCEELDFSHCPMWIQMHNVPMEAMCLKNVVMIGGYVGEVVLAEDPCSNGRFLRSFLRARVILDLRVGHGNRTCNSEKLMSVPNPNDPRYGAWLTTTSCHNWDEVMEVVRHDWGEAEYVTRKKEEALLRQKDVPKQRDGMASVFDEDELFCIKVNKSFMEVKGPVVRTDKGEKDWKRYANIVDTKANLEERDQGWGPRPLNEVLSYVPNVVTAEDNAGLMQPVTSLEIEETIFQLGTNKAPELLHEGEIFPQRSEQSVPVFTPPQTQPLASYPQNLRNSDFQQDTTESSVKPDFPTLRSVSGSIYLNLKNFGHIRSRLLHVLRDQGGVSDIKAGKNCPKRASHSFGGCDQLWGCSQNHLAVIHKLFLRFSCLLFNYWKKV
ncbi:hypothetical protein K1719_003938 [Acacia pycnantha]|nr:hypothetical protein K1719_003938 [Acacia pycnantha]